MLNFFPFKKVVAQPEGVARGSGQREHRCLEGLQVLPKGTGLKLNSQSKVMIIRKQGYDWVQLIVQLMVNHD